MAPREKKGGEVESAQRPDSTLRFNVREPQMDSVTFLSPPLRLYTLRQHFSGFSLVHSSDPAGFNFENFVRNIRGMKRIELEGMGLDVLFTRTSAFITIHGIPGSLRAISHIIGDEAAGRVNMAADKNSNPLTICRITLRELNALLKSSSKPDCAALCPDSILPADSSSDVDLAEFKGRLAKSEVVSSDGPFDIADFARRVNLVSVFRDELDAGYFVVGMKDDESVYSLYVNTCAPQVSEENPMVARLKYNKDTLTLFRVEVIG